MVRINSFCKLSLYPTIEDLHSKELEFVRPNKVQGAFESVDDYLDTHFRLVREDFINPLRLGFNEYRIKRLNHLNEYPARYGNLRIYKKTKFESQNGKDDNGNVIHGSYVVNFDPYKRLKDTNWNNNKHFLHGSLLLFSNNEFSSFFCARIHGRSIKSLKNGRLLVKLDVSNGRSPLSETFLMAESDVFFDPYFAVMRVLKGLNESIFPMKNYIIQADCRIRCPVYLEKQYRLKLFGNVINPFMSWPSHEKFGLDCHQYHALQAALTRQFCIIQGPPGTGKTFLGLQIVRVLLDNVQQNMYPIVIVCFTNFALDQFLERILKISCNVVRIGGQSQSQKLKKYNMNEKKKARRQSQLGRSRLYGEAEELAILRTAAVVGMTTTCAAQKNSLFTMLKPAIVIVEEAAEVLEAHVIASLTPYTQHIILIGDHKQLRPSVNVEKLKTEYNMDISLFERMINNKMDCPLLKVQHRMRPEISSLISPSIYKNLENHKKVYEYECIIGMRHSVFFISHNELEMQRQNSTSYINKHEAEFALALCSYLLEQGYSSKKITILSTYVDQMNYLVESSRGNKLREVDFAVTDGYQGKENDIIILSLVRSNLDGKIGFLSVENRVCVALSRAKKGFYIIGNMDILSRRSPLWQEVQKTLNAQELIGRVLELRCDKHGTLVEVASAADFQRVHPGFCKSKCDMVFKCGHSCRYTCHRHDMPHRRSCEGGVHGIWKTAYCGHAVWIKCDEINRGLGHLFMKCEECSENYSIGWSSSFRSVAPTLSTTPPLVTPRSKSKSKWYCNII